MSKKKVEIDMSNGAWAVDVEKNEEFMKLNCKHGQLKRSCQVCEYEAEIERLREKLHHANIEIIDLKALADRRKWGAQEMDRLRARVEELEKMNTVLESDYKALKREHNWMSAEIGDKAHDAMREAMMTGDPTKQCEKDWGR